MKTTAICKAVVCTGLFMCTASAIAEVRIRDNFEYVVTRDQIGKAAAFAANGGWDYAKSNPEAARACGYIYTTNAIPGYSGAFPGTNSSRVLAMEFLPRSMNCLVGTSWYQTDAYLQKGGESAAQNTIPPNTWYQFWIYINNSGTQQTRWDGQGTKWLYPCINGAPTCTGSNISFLYLLKQNSYNPYSSTATGADAYIELEGFGASYAPGGPSPEDRKLGHNVAPGTGKLVANTWILVKVHIDLSGSQGVYQEWHKTVGGSFVQTANWVGGVTSGFVWPLSGLNPSRSVGQKSLKLGTTWNNYDGWIYLDDFVMATSEADLPVYGVGSVPPPPPPPAPVLPAPTNLR